MSTTVLEQETEKEAISLIDETLKLMSERSMFTSEEITNILLDIRLKIET